MQNNIVVILEVLELKLLSTPFSVLFFSLFRLRHCRQFVYFSVNTMLINSRSKALYYPECRGMVVTKGRFLRFGTVCWSRLTFFVNNSSTIKLRLLDRRRELLDFTNKKQSASNKTDPCKNPSQYAQNIHFGSGTHLCTPFSSTPS